METDYYRLHTFFDQTKMCFPSNLHRLVIHNDFSIQICEQVYGTSFQRSSDGEMILTGKVARQHIIEDFGFIPTLSICMQNHPFHQAERRLPFLTQEEQAERLMLKLGGTPEDYRELVAWFNSPGESLGDPRFFRFLGNRFGIFLSDACFGMSITRSSDEKLLSTRYVAEQLMLLILNYISTLSHFFRGIPVEAWMCKGAKRLPILLEAEGEETYAM